VNLIQNVLKSLILYREKYLEPRSIYSIAGSLGKLSRQWLNKDFFYRRKALEKLVKNSGFTKKMSEALLDALFTGITEKKLLKLLQAEIQNPRFLDGFQKDPVSGNFRRARGPRLVTHIFSGNVPNPALLSFIFGMLVKSVNIGKCSSKDEGFLGIYLESLRALDPQLAATNTILKPTIGAQYAAPLRECIEQSGLVVAYGNNESLKEIKNHLPAGTPFLGYGHKVSFSFYAKECLTPKNSQVLAKKTAHDIWMLDQRGCLSPATIYIEGGGIISPHNFAGFLARSLESLSVGAHGLAPLHRTLHHAQILNRYTIRKIKGENIRFWESSVKGRWLVIYEDKNDLPLSSGQQVIYVKGLKNTESLYKTLLPMQKYLQAVALEAGAARRLQISEKLAQLGINRICRAGQMQEPPLFWRHDGLPNLASWLKWTDLEY